MARASPTRSGPTTVWAYLLLTALALVLVFPIVWMLSTSLKTVDRSIMFPPQWVPDPVEWRNYVSLFTERSWLLYARNSFAIAGGATLGSVLSSSIVAYGFARLRFTGRDFWFSVLLSTMILPSVVTLIPTFLLFKSLGWYNTWLPLIVPYWFGINAFNTFLLRQFYLTLPAELDEAARIDGANSLQIYWHVVMPLSRTVLVVVLVLSFIHSWNDFLGPLVFLQDQGRWPMALGMRVFLRENAAVWNLIMAASTVMMAPVVALFLAVQRYFTQGIVMTGLSGR